MLYFIEPCWIVEVREYHSVNCVDIGRYNTISPYQYIEEKRESTSLHQYWISTSRSSMPNHWDRTSLPVNLCKCVYMVHGFIICVKNHSIRFKLIPAVGNTE